jgi:hypothetical protein
MSRTERHGSSRGRVRAEGRFAGSVALGDLFDSGVGQVRHNEGLGGRMFMLRPGCLCESSNRRAQEIGLGDSWVGFGGSEVGACAFVNVVLRLVVDATHLGRPRSDPKHPQSDDAVASVASLIRGLHDASVDLAFDDASWSSELADSKGGPVICHNDVRLENVVF